MAEATHTRTAFDVKDLHRQLADFTPDELRQLPVVPEGGRLEEGAVYIDLLSPHRRELTATGGMAAPPGHYYAAKAEVDYRLWNRLIGVTNPERTGGGPA